jgi:Flp pilus assembly protein TadG
MNGERGSAAVEAVLIAPVLLLLLAVLVGGGQLVSDQAAIRAVAREAGRVAVTAASGDEAIRWGETSGRETAAGYRLDVSELVVTVLPGSFRRGGNVTVRVAYDVSLSDLPAFGLIPGRARLTAAHVEPIDIYRSR